ncbi:MAG: lysophospholipid acyltransferase family protein [Desulfobacteraceae bacterium]|nr:lysophospholipid acyltransferase family protein [Pseudomonadota bacterium]MBU4464120.1 lysophospholipid acyltransferase family protein [Pseudomonadota bacterium]MCG2754353.1 lysophospholipid acyltransferase family protein [Desulfobacteraceae bacterium]
MRVKQKNRISDIKWNLVGIFGKLLIDLLFSTMKIEREGLEKVKPIISSGKVIFAVWHSRMLLFSYLCKGLNGTAMVSKSKDGELAARIIQRQGHEAIRGSTKKGGLQALSRLIRKVKGKNKVCLIVPDGPQGPRYKVQPGIIILAKKTGYPIVPISYSARKIKIFASWDRFILPLPFTKCRAVYGAPIYVPQDTDKNEGKRCLMLLENELNRITSDVDRYYGHNIT